MLDKKEKDGKLFLYIKTKRRVLNEVSIVINVIFLVILFLEFFIPTNDFVKKTQIFIGLFFLLELYMRMKLHKFKLRYVLSFFNVLDTAIIIIIFVRFFYIDSTILHFLTALKIFRSYRIIHELSKINNFFSNNKILIFSVINIFIFTLFMSSIVFMVFSSSDEDINNYLDALYFTISTLTTTGFGDITPHGNTGKILVIIIMTLGTGLFLRLLTVIFRPIKKYYKCEHCGLTRHDKDASHCKHCGNTVYIEHIGDEIL